MYLIWSSFSNGIPFILREYLCTVRHTACRPESNSDVWSRQAPQPPPPPQWSVTTYYTTGLAHLLLAHNFTARSVILKLSLLGTRLRISSVTLHPFRLRTHFVSKFLRILLSVNSCVSGITASARRANSMSNYNNTTLIFIHIHYIASIRVVLILPKRFGFIFIRTPIAIGLFM